MTRAFVIGNGPSLRDTPLDKLQGEVTFAMNRINLRYPHVEWRPTYYLAFDWTGPHMLEDTLINVEAAEHSFIRADRANEVELARRGFEWPPRVSYLWSCRSHVACNVDSTNRPIGWHLPNVCAYGSTLNVAVQMAAMMGHNPIILLGCDLGFRSFVAGEPDPNHFDPDYIGWDDFPIETRDATLLHMHGVMERETRALGFLVLNATVGGALEVHRRVDLVEVLR